MANPYFVEPASPLQALMTGVQGYEGARKRATEDQRQVGRQNALQRLMSGDAKGAMAESLGAGDHDAAKAIAQFAHQQATEAQAKAQLEQSKAQFGASHGLARQQFEETKRQADLAGKGFDYKEVDDSDGGKMLVRIHRASGEVTKPPIAGAPSEPTNPYAQGTSTEGQANARLYASRMFAAEKVLREPSVVDASTSVGQKVIRGVAGEGTAGNLAVSEGTQKREQAERNFVNAVLRRESGAVINPEEFKSAEKQYFPRPGDTPEVIKQKQANRVDAIKGIAGAGGRSYRPPASFGPQGELVPGGQKPGQQAPNDPLGIR